MAVEKSHDEQVQEHLSAIQSGQEPDWSSETKPPEVTPPPAAAAAVVEPPKEEPKKPTVEEELAVLKQEYQDLKNRFGTLRNNRASASDIAREIREENQKLQTELAELKRKIELKELEGEKPAGYDELAESLAFHEKKTALEKPVEKKAAPADDPKAKKPEEKPAGEVEPAAEYSEEDIAWGKTLLEGNPDWFKQLEDPAFREGMAKFAKENPEKYAADAKFVADESKRLWESLKGKPAAPASQDDSAIEHELKGQQKPQPSSKAGGGGGKKKPLDEVIAEIHAGKYTAEQVSALEKEYGLT
jgi:hypothetical protein